MKFLIATLITLSTAAAYGSDLCSRHENNVRYFTALKSVAVYLGYDLEQLCHHPSLLDIEIHPNRIITRDGEIEPHVRVQFNKNYESCYYLVRDLDQKITNSRCYSTF